MPSAPAVLPPAPERVDHGLDLPLVAHPRRLERRPRVPCVSDDRDRVVGLQLAQQHRERLLHERQLVRLLHRPRRVDQEDEVRVRLRRPAHRIALDPDPDELAPRRPRARHHRDIGAERRLLRPRRRVVIAEVVDQFLAPHRIRLREDVAVERRAHPRIRRRVDVDREGRDRDLANDLERIFVGMRELVAALIVVRRRRPLRHVHARSGRRGWRRRRRRHRHHVHRRRARQRGSRQLRPGHDDALGLGFLGTIRRRRDLVVDPRLRAGNKKQGREAEAHIMMVAPHGRLPFLGGAKLAAQELGRGSAGNPLKISPNCEITAACEQDGVGP